MHVQTRCHWAPTGSGAEGRRRAEQHDGDRGIRAGHGPPARHAGGRGATTGRAFVHVLVGGIDRFCVILLDGHKAHVVSREHVVAVSLDQSMLLQITTDNAFVPRRRA